MSVELPGAAPEHIDLLRQAGIERVEQLRAADPQSLWNDLAAANDYYNIMESPPSQELVAHWVGVAEHFEEGRILAEAEAVELPGKTGEKQKRGRRRRSDSESEQQPSEPDEKQRPRRKRKTGNSA